MTYLRAALIITAAALTWACSVSRTEERAESLGYEMKEYRLTSTPGCEGDSACAEFKVSYPVFSGMDSTISKTITRELELVFSLGDPEAETKTLQQEATEFLESYRSFTKEFEGMESAWFFHGEARVNVLTDTLISISADEEYYTGGAHGGGGRYFINVNPRNGTKVTLASVLKPGFETPLLAAGEAAFRKERELPANADLFEAGFEFPENTFRLNDNYGFTNEGIVFFFNNYEIGAYALGPTEILIPFSEISDWLKAKPVRKNT